MKLLLDENLSHRLIRTLTDTYPGTVHVRDVGLLGAPDEEIWTYAAQHDFLLVSKDADFYQRSVLRGAPPKVLWLRIGNASTDAIARLLRERFSVVEHFSADREASFLDLHPN